MKMFVILQSRGTYIFRIINLILIQYLENVSLVISLCVYHSVHLHMVIYSEDIPISDDTHNWSKCSENVVHTIVQNVMQNWIQSLFFTDICYCLMNHIFWLIFRSINEAFLQHCIIFGNLVSFLGNWFTKS